MKRYLTTSLVLNNGALIFKSKSYFEKTALHRKANRKSQKSFPFVKMIENHGGVLIHFNQEQEPRYLSGLSAGLLI